MTSHPPPLDVTAAALLRLCHDLAGAAGTIVNALDLAAAPAAATDPAMAAEALGLAAEAAREVTARIALARALWNEDEPLSVSELRHLTKGLPNAARLQLDLDALDPAPLPPAAARVLLASLITAAEALRGPGAIAAAGSPSRGITICIAGLRAVWPPALLDQAALPPPPSPRSIAPILARLLADQSGARLSFLLHTGRAETPPPLLITFPP